MNDPGIQKSDVVSEASNNQAYYPLDAAGVGTWDLELGAGKAAVIDDRCKELLGVAKDSNIPYENGLTFIHPEDKEAVQLGLSRVFDPKLREPYNMRYRIYGRDDGKLRLLSFKGKAYFDTNNLPYRFSGIVIDDSEQLSVKEPIVDIQSDQLKVEDLFNHVTRSSPTGLWLSEPEGNWIYLNETLVNWTGKTYSALLRWGWLNAIIEEDREKAANAFRNAMTTRSHYDVEFRIGKSDGSFMWCRAAGDPFFRKDGSYGGYAGFCMDIDERVKNITKLRESELYIRSIFHNSPVAKMVFTGYDMVITTINQNMIEMLGHGDSVVGKPFMEAMPELIATPLMSRLRHVLATGETFYQPEEKISFLKHGQPHTGYYSYIYKPLHNTEGEIYGVMCTCTEVTEQSLAKQQKEEAEQSLREAIEIAELGTWSFDLSDKTMTYSKRMQEWYGFKTDKVSIEEVISLMSEEDKKRMQQNFEQVLKQGSKGNTNDEHTIVNQITGQRRIIHSIGKSKLNEEGKIIKIEGTSRDVTAQRQIQLELESEVQRRTLELQASNAQLEATNEELAETIENLNHSNEELSQYAYIASHDLQEPLRKIRVYADMLEKDTEIQESKMRLISKISQSSDRMILLIKDLLEFSRLLSAEKMYSLVDLSAVVNDVITDFELVIQEKNATITIQSKLPCIEGISLQLNQLFYNLINNALKFVKKEVPPVITIHVTQLTSSEIKKLVPRFQTGKTYFDIQITDNGIGFDQKFSEQIFEVFKRLHGRDIYPGSGIGLALCKKIVMNHGGYLYAESQVNKGSTFHIVLPGKH